MDLKKILIGGAIAFLGYKLYQKYQLLKNINISVANFSVAGNITNPQITIDLKVSNPTGTSVNFSNLNGFIKNRSGENIAALSIMNSYQIDGYSQQIIPLKIDTNIANTVIEIANYLKNKSATYIATGTAYFDNVSLPFKSSITF